MKNFAVVQEHFRKLRCAHCQQAFTPEGVKLLREEKDYWVVRVHCTSCQQPAGVAIVGVEYESSDAPVPERERTERDDAEGKTGRTQGHVNVHMAGQGARPKPPARKGEPQGLAAPLPVRA